MSYRAFKRLLGETSLERKCRFLFGAGILLLITASFWWYAHMTEDLAYDQTETTGRLLVPLIVAKLHQPLDKEQRATLLDFQKKWEANRTEAVQQYQYKILKPNSHKTGNPLD